MNKAIDKHALRTAALAFRQSMLPDQRQCYSEKIIDTLLSYLADSQISIHHLLAYRSLPSEVDTATFFHLPDYHLFAPVTHHHEHMQWHQITAQTRWRNGLFGISEPDSGIVWGGEEGTVLLCPLAAFDRVGNRLGMGKGCFDFWLAEHRSQISQVIGLAFSGQEVAHIPAERHDVPMDCIITEKEVIECSKQAPR